MFTEATDSKHFILSILVITFFASLLTTLPTAILTG